MRPVIKYLLASLVLALLFASPAHTQTCSVNTAPPSVFFSDSFQNRHPVLMAFLDGVANSTRFSYVGAVRTFDPTRYSMIGGIRSGRYKAVPTATQTEVDWGHGQGMPPRTPPAPWTPQETRLTGGPAGTARYMSPEQVQECRQVDRGLNEALKKLEGSGGGSSSAAAIPIVLSAGKGDSSSVTVTEGVDYDAVCQAEGKGKVAIPGANGGMQCTCPAGQVEVGPPGATWCKVDPGPRKPPVARPTGGGGSNGTTGPINGTPGSITGTPAGAFTPGSMPAGGSGYGVTSIGSITYGGGGNCGDYHGVAGCLVDKN